MEKKFLKLIIILSVIIILFNSFFIIKVLYLDKMFNEEKKLKLIKVIEKYYDDEELPTAMNIAEQLYVNYPDDKKITDLLDKILKAEKEKNNIDELQRQVKYKEDLNNLALLIAKMLNKNSSSIINSVNRKNYEKVKLTSSDFKFRNEKENLYTIDIINKLETAKRLYYESNYREAKRLFLEILISYENEPYANSYLAAIIFNENPENDINIQEAVNRCNKAIKENDQIELAHYILAGIYDYKGIKESAIDKYNDTIRLNPINYKAMYSLGKIYYELKDFTSAEQYLINSINLKNDFLNGYYFLARTEIKLNKYDKAKIYFEKILEFDSKFHSAYEGLADIYLHENSKETAIELYKKALSIEGKFEYASKIAECYRSLSKLSDAIPYYKKSLEYNYKDYNVLYNLALCYKNIKDYNNAISTFKAAIEQNSDFIDAYYELGESFYLVKKYDDAKTILNELLAKQPEYPKKDKIISMFENIRSRKK